MMTTKTQKQRQKPNPEYRNFVNGSQFETFIRGQGLLPDPDELAEQFDYDWHARKLKFSQHFRGQILMQAAAYSSTRDHQWAAQNDVLFASCGAAVNISVSGLAQANKNRPLEPQVVYLHQVLDAVANLPYRRLRQLDKETWQGLTGLLRRTDIFDATTLSLPPSVAEWSAALARSDVGGAGCKLHLKLAGDTGAIKQIQLTQATGTDSPYFDELLGDLEAQTGTIFLFDGGYWNLETYHAITAAGHHFVTKRAGSIAPRVIDEYPLPDQPLASGYQVLRDARVYLGQSTQHVYRMLEVKLTSGEQITVLTNLLMLPADKICLLYRYRWTIEIVFRWLQQLLQLDEHLMSHHPRGILRQILTALIVWGLLILANQGTDQLSPKQLWRQLQADLHQAVFEFGYRRGVAQATAAT